MSRDNLFSICEILYPKKEIEEELNNYKPEDDENNKKKRNILFTVPGIIILLIVLGLAFYRIFHFFFLI